GFWPAARRVLARRAAGSFRHRAAAGACLPCLLTLAVRRVPLADRVRHGGAGHEGETCSSQPFALSVTEGETTRLRAWSQELRAVHDRLREAWHITQQAVAAGTPAEAASRDLLLFCHGFCTALTGHHEGEDRQLFPAIAAAHPELADTLR